MVAQKTELRPGALIELTIEQPAVGGRMIGRYAGRIVLVSGAIPGERVRARIEGVRREVPLASVEDVLEADPDRRPVDGDPACGGNAFAHVAYPRQLTLKQQIVADAFLRIARLPAPEPLRIVPSPERGYRMRARLHVAGTRLGFFRERSHYLCDAAATGQLSGETLEVLDGVHRAFESGGAAGIRALEIVESVAGDQRLLHAWLDRGQSSLPPALVSLVGLRGVTGVSAAMGRADSPRIVAGRSEIADSLSDVLPIAGTAVPVVRRHAASFFQSNRPLLGPLAAHVVEALGEDPIVDLYAGVGLFALSAVARGHRDVTAVEGDAISGEDLARNVAATRGAARAARQSVERHLRDFARPAAGTWIVDPPRRGLSRDARARVAACGPPRLVYVSCDVATLARDLRVLVDAGYTIRAVEGFDLFPRTAHLELVVMLEREAAITSEGALRTP